MVILSAYDDDALVRAALDAGATGYLLKTIGGVRSSWVQCGPHGSGNHGPRPHPVVAVGGSAWPAECGQRTPAHLAPAQETVDTRGRGALQQSHRARLGVSARTVEGHLNHVFVKLGVESRTELVRFVLTNGLIATTPSSELEP